MTQAQHNQSSTYFSHLEGGQGIRVPTVHSRGPATEHPPLRFQLPDPALNLIQDLGSTQKAQVWINVNSVKHYPQGMPHA